MAHELFADLARQEAPRNDGGEPRYVEARRDEITFDRFEFDSLIGEDHAARGIWAYLEKVDLRALYERIEARAHTPGRPATDPRVLLGLWLYACVEGVGSARELERLTVEHNGFRWLRGGVPLNYHLLSNFRWQAAEIADQLLTQSVVALWSEGLVDLASLTQDGLRVRASAGAASFRRQATLERLLAEVEERLRRLKQEMEADRDASRRRLQAGRQRIERERKARIEAALAAAQAVAAQQAAAAAKKKAKAKTPTPPGPGGAAVADSGRPQEATDVAAADTAKKPKEPRFSTTDVEAHVMRMPDSGYRPAYNPQLTSITGKGVIVGVGMDMTGSDGGLMLPAVQDVERRYGVTPLQWLVDGGYTKLSDITAVARRAVTVYCPPKPRRNPKNDPAAPRYGDPPEIIAWRQRMVDDAKAGKAGCMRRRSEHERINANFRLQGLHQFNVRGCFKVRVVCVLHALANNFLAAVRLRAAAA